MNYHLAGFLGPGAKYQGDLVFEGRVRIDGHFKGKIQSNDLLEIGTEGSVEGEVEVAQALICGRFSGNLLAKERCTLLETAQVVGKITTPWIDIRLGCQFQGELQVKRESSSPKV